MSWDPDGSGRSLFSSAYSSRTSAAGARSGIAPCHKRIAALRVPVAMPARSMYRTVGCNPTTTMDPGGAGLCRDMNGWSIHPPANAMR